jgi:cyclopropane fatty-acyl-phospholipid synthase-like methyltransferase
LDSVSLERLVPDDLASGDATGLETLALHVERYEFAARRLPRGRLLDVGCGVGYGTALLVEHSGSEARAVGVDISPEAIAYARERYGTPQIHFRVGDVLGFEDEAGFDGIVALEIVEHVGEPEALIERLLTLLRPEGVLVASVPTTPSTDLNPHHRRDFTERSFRALFRQRGLVQMDSLRQKQRVPVGAVLRRREARMQDLRRGLGRYYLRHPMALLHRLQATVTYGFANCYTTIAWRKMR